MPYDSWIRVCFLIFCYPPLSPIVLITSIVFRKLCCVNRDKSQNKRITVSDSFHFCLSMNTAIQRVIVSGFIPSRKRQKCNTMLLMRAVPMLNTHLESFTSRAHPLMWDQKLMHWSFWVLLFLPLNWDTRKTNLTILLWRLI